MLFISIRLIRGSTVPRGVEVKGMGALDPKAVSSGRPAWSEIEGKSISK